MLPEAFVSSMISERGSADALALCRALDTEPVTSVRLNPAKSAGAVLPGDAVRIPWSSHGYILPQRPQFTLDTAFHAGAYYVQEPSSQFTGYLLEASGFSGGRILDMCAAPGGKTTHYASLAGAGGLVVANEIDRRRAQVLADNVRKWGLGNTVVTCNEPSRAASLAGFFDVVAVDAPCSGEGMFRKDPASRSEWSERNVSMCAARQEDILRHAWRALRPGGLLLYSTCTFNRTENEDTLRRFAAFAGSELTEAEPVALPDAGIECGRTEAFRTYRFLPHRLCGEGFFAAVARKSADAASEAAPSRPRRTIFVPADRAAATELDRYSAEPGAMRFFQVGELYYGYRAETFDLVRTVCEQMSAIYSGTAFGRIFKGRLKPEHAAAMYAGLRREQFAQAELPDDEALDYLRCGRTDPARFAEGLNLVTARGAALGFAKRIGHRVNNMYPMNLRILNK